LGSRGCLVALSCAAACTAVAAGWHLRARRRATASRRAGCSSVHDALTSAASKEESCDAPGLVAAFQVRLVLVSGRAVHVLTVRALHGRAGRCKPCRSTYNALHGRAAAAAVRTVQAGHRGRVLRACALAPRLRCTRQVVRLRAIGPYLFSVSADLRRSKALLAAARRPQQARCDGCLRFAGRPADRRPGPLLLNFRHLTPLTLRSTRVCRQQSRPFSDGRSGRISASFGARTVSQASAVHH
jgi:hypothetical protein